ncbi:uncharacterized protein LOC116778095 isoform X3 [Danaus plexippus]|uniref:uncharacterized protein LOC116778095 isoform X3 n=1 Tax=Danaus plexippus TaxID=13037 RepID=UPI002AAFB22A|nr:uncharacterized protein LOC116778095 isoform X3 [Danaus plexippus]
MGMKVMAFAGVITMLQAVTQAIFSSLSLAQYFCLIDFLRDLPFLIYIKILYLHNPDCGSRINIGKVIEGIPDQAFVLLTNEPLTVTRTFYINSASLGLSVLWFLASIILMAGKEKSGYLRPLRWPWVFISIAVCGCDVVATVIFANDSFYTRTLTEVMDYIGGTISGIGNKQLDTSLTAWIMVALYSRFAVFFVINLILIVIVVLDKSKPQPDISIIESPIVPALPPPPPLPPPQPPLPQITQSQTPKPQVVTPVHLPIRRVSEPIVARKVSNSADDRTVLSIPLSNITEASTSTRDIEDSSIREDSSKIPRAGFNNAFRTMKRFLFTKPSISQRASVLDSSYTSPERSPKIHHREIDKKRTVNFPANLLSLPQRLENMIAEQQRRLDNAVIDTGRSSPPRASQSLPQLNDSPDGDATLPQNYKVSCRGPTFQRQHTACVTSCHQTKTCLQCRYRTIRHYIRFAKHLYIEQPLA